MNKYIIAFVFCLIALMSALFFARGKQEASAKPRVSIVTSIYKGDEFIEGFLADVVRQTIFGQSELILINAASPGNEEAWIKPYLEKYPNISYERLDRDPGVYGVWNRGIKKAKGEYITNANIDDRRNPVCLEMHVKALDENPDVDLVYSDYLITRVPNETFEQNSSQSYCFNQEFSPAMMYRCLPGPEPLWRKSMHEKAGYFSEDFVTSGDHEMWNRAVSKGCKFMKVGGLCGLYYENPHGLSTKADSKKNEEDAFILAAYTPMWGNLADSSPKLLIKLASRSDPDKLFNALNLYYKNLSGGVGYHFLITLDENDPSMNTAAVRGKLDTYPYLSYYFGTWGSPVFVTNRDIEKYPAFDVLWIATDDIVAIAPGFDRAVTQPFRESCPNGDGIIFAVSSVKSQNQRFPIIGKAYYERFGYVYHPDYHSGYYQNDCEAVAKILRKFGGVKKFFYIVSSPNLQKQEETEDLNLFTQRRGAAFDLNPQWIAEGDARLWSILICTLEERREAFDKLQGALKQQIEANHLVGQVEILCCQDNRESPVGLKRNLLLQLSQGKYVSFIDDDDNVHERYVPMIYEKLLLNPDCVSLTGIMTTDGQNPRKFIHSIAYQSYFEKEGTYFRPPNHLNPIKREIAIQFNFPEVSYGEDTPWAMQIAESGLLQKEESIKEPYYFYLWEPAKGQ